MYSYEFDGIIPIENESLLLNGDFIWIIQAHRIPPHIGISSDGKYYSVKAKGKDVRLSLDRLIKVVHAKNKLVVCVEVIGLKGNLLDQLDAQFTQFNEINESVKSCLTPIKEVLLPGENLETVSDLLKSLKTKQRIGRIYGLNLTEDFRGIPMYTQQDIQSRINTLKDAARNKSELTTG